MENKRPADAVRTKRSTDVSAEEVFQAIGQLRREAHNEIEPLLAFFDDADGDPDLEPYFGSGCRAATIARLSSSDAHHLGFAQPRAMGRKVSDEFTLPLCRVAADGPESIYIVA